MQKTLGGDRLGSGKKLSVDLHNFERSTHDLGYLWRSTMSSGTLVPFLKEIALPGDTFDINLDCDVKTHPTIGPLFGSYKVQLDVFQAPIRLYNALLHNNKLGIGMDMKSVYLPVMTATALERDPLADINTSQVNPSCILNYLGLKGIGQVSPGDTSATRSFNAIPLLAYWEIYKNYYANKQEEIGAVIHNDEAGTAQTVTAIDISDGGSIDNIITQYPTQGYFNLDNMTTITIDYTGTPPNPDFIIINTDQGDVSLGSLGVGFIDNSAQLVGGYVGGAKIAYYWRYAGVADIGNGVPKVVTFNLSDIDDMREAILSTPSTTTPFEISASTTQHPYDWLFELGATSGIPNMLSTQEGLACKTYQSDLFNNWLQTEWIDGTTGINAITAIDTSGGSFNIDTFILSEKVYKMMMRIAVSGGSYDDWLDAVYAHERYTRCESPMYMGGLIKELVFQEVVSNSASDVNGNSQQLGTLAGKGVMAKKHKGGKVTIKVDEPSYIIGLISLTPRVDYSQGNKWDLHLETMDDLHKPSLDQIGFQELITEQMAWWDTNWENGPNLWNTKSAGKQPAWINYMTNVNETHGNFAIPDNEMFMTLNRRYEYDDTNPTLGSIKDLTTYIDPSKFNFIFAETALDAQNFWAQIAVDITARRKMSAKVMPNL